MSPFSTKLFGGGGRGATALCGSAPVSSFPVASGRGNDRRSSSRSCDATSCTPPCICLNVRIFVVHSWEGGEIAGEGGEEVVRCRGEVEAGNGAELEEMAGLMNPTA